MVEDDFVGPLERDDTILTDGVDWGEIDRVDRIQSEDLSRLQTSVVCDSRLFTCLDPQVVIGLQHLDVVVVERLHEDVREKA